MKGVILVCGGAGYIGSHVVKELGKKGYRPLVYDNLSTGHRWAVKNYDLVEEDLGTGKRLDAVFEKERPGAVMHFAASALVSESVKRPEVYFRNNVGNSLNLLEAMLRRGVKNFIFSSSAAVYGNPQQIPISEDQALNPVNPYGETKAFIEKVLRWYGGAHDFRYVSLRYFNAAGADPSGDIGEDHDPETHLIPCILQVAAGERPFVEVYGTDYDTPDGTCVRDYIHVSDLAQAHILALEALMEGRPSQIYNLGNQQGFSVREVIEAAREVTGRPIPSRDFPRRPGDPPVLVAGSGKIKGELGWRPQFDELKVIIETAWRWMKDGRRKRRGRQIDHR